MVVRVRLFLGEQDGLVCEVNRAPQVLWVPSIVQQNEVEAGVRNPDIPSALPYVQFRIFYDVSGVEVHDYRFTEDLLEE